MSLTFLCAFFVVQRASTTLTAVNRRDAIGQLAFVTGAVVLPSVVSADGAVSSATTGKAKAIYGARIADLAAAVESGDFGAVAAEKNAFILFNSGVYPSVKEKASKAAAVEATNAIFAAIKSQDKAALKAAYSGYVASNDIAPIPDVAGDGQGYSSDYSYYARTPAA